MGRSHVQRYIDAAHQHGALPLLTLQPGRTDFLQTAQRRQWALEDPWVGPALDPEWRFGATEVPRQTIGSVSAREINKTAGWLSRLTGSRDLPKKLFAIHQFQDAMVPGIGKVRSCPGLAMVQNVDGFGSPADKLATYAGVARPRKFTVGLKIFYGEDQPRMRQGDVRRLRDVRFRSSELGRSELGELAIRARDAEVLAPEVDGHGTGFDVDDTTDAVGVVANLVAHVVLLDGRLGFGGEGAAGEVAAHWSSH